MLQLIKVQLSVFGEVVRMYVKDHDTGLASWYNTGTFKELNNRKWKVSPFAKEELVWGDRIHVKSTIVGGKCEKH